MKSTMINLDQNDPFLFISPYKWYFHALIEGAVIFYRWVGALEIQKSLALSNRVPSICVH